MSTISITKERTSLVCNAFRENMSCRNLLLQWIRILLQGCDCLVAIWSIEKKMMFPMGSYHSWKWAKIDFNNFNLLKREPAWFIMRLDKLCLLLIYLTPMDQDIAAGYHCLVAIWSIEKKMMFPMGSYHRWKWAKIDFNNFNADIAARKSLPSSYLVH
ncbi:uncharacterized protein LOC117654118 [Thrips palmi]|uniref:Uncharacterized protein LOC117654118 n=1 Tax=Thrips palmi TaxID=161013 RepID=A0A6P9AD89_THRPL|nr:uncharacterized protein LOC117654118 [Thrips palmi]